MSQGRLTKEDLDPRLVEEIENNSTHLEEVAERNEQHLNDRDNPHGVTAEQLALGNVQNFGVANQAEAESGTSTTKYMTPQRTKQAIDKNLIPISQSIQSIDTQFTQLLDGKVKKGELIYNVKDFGAKLDGVTDDTLALQNALALGDIYIPEGTCLCNIKWNTKHNIYGAGQNKTFLKSYSTNGYAITIKSSSPHWITSKLSNLGFVGDNLNRNGIEFGESEFVISDEIAGRILFSQVYFNNLNKAVHKRYGNIGNTFDNCYWANNNYHFYAESKQSLEYIMHAGCDTFYKGEMSGAKKACFFIDSPFVGTGQTILRDIVLELNPGFVFFIENYGAEAWSPGLILENVWFEGNATAENVMINDVIYTPKDLRLKNNPRTVMSNCNIGKIELINSILVCENCSTGDNYASIIKDNKSIIISDKSNFYKNKSTDIYNSNIVMASAPVGNSTIFNTKPRNLITTAYSDKLIFAETFAKGTLYQFPGDSTRFGRTVPDGSLFNFSNELSINPNGISLFSEFIVPSDKYLVWSINARLISGNTAIFGLNATGSLIDNIPLSNEWNSFLGLTNTKGMGSFTAQLYIKASAGGVCTLRFNALQVLAFDSLEEAVKFIDGGLYQLPINQPKTIYSTSPPTTGNWIIGDRVVNTGPVAGGFSGWICTQTGTPGVWKGFGLIEE